MRMISVAAGRNTFRTQGLAVYMAVYMAVCMAALSLSILSMLTGCGQSASVAQSPGETAHVAPATSGSINSATKQPADPEFCELTHEDLDAIAWVQTSAEYAAITRQVYRMAGEHLDEVITDKRWSALPDQQERLAQAAGPDDELPLAVILDVDETCLDNSGYQEELIHNGGEYTRESWTDWANRASALPIPGAKGFIDLCRSKGIEVFFVTNREHNVEQPTVENLKAYGLLPESADGTNVLCKREQEDWSSNKSNRRELIGKSHRVLMLLGDDLNDFAWVGKHPTSKQRRDLATTHETMWGKSWFMLPNPSYGGWERAMYEFKDALPRRTKLRLKREHLRGALNAANSAANPSEEQGASEEQAPVDELKKAA